MGGMKAETCDFPHVSTPPMDRETATLRCEKPASTLREFPVSACYPIRVGEYPLRIVDEESTSPALQYPMNPGRAERFWARTRLDGDCLIWTGAKDAHYGKVKYLRKFVGAHRIAYELANGAFAAGLLIRHTCDRPLCVAPAHLIPGTHLDNSNDKCHRGRASHPRGELNPQAKLTAAQVIAIRTLRADRHLPEAIGARFGVSIETIYNIASGWTWKHVGGPITKPRVRPSSRKPTP